MLETQELPDCFYQNQPVLIFPSSPTPEHSLYLSNIDDQKFLRFTIKYLYLYSKSLSPDVLKLSLSRVLVDYYPMAGRLRKTAENDQKLEVHCNSEGALFAEAFMDMIAQEVLELSRKPNRSWRKLLYRVEAQSFLDVPPLVVQVTYLRCGGMILCTAINHCLCDGIGSSQFLQAWAHITSKPNLDLPISPVHSRHVLRPRDHPKITFTHPQYVRKAPGDDEQHVEDITQYLRSQPLVVASLTFTAAHVRRLKQQCVPPLKCTTFEAMASHAWRSWVLSLDLSPSLNVKLIFPVNVRKRMVPEISQGYYGNGFVLGCAQSLVKELVGNSLYHVVKLVQQAKASLTDEYVRSLIDLLEDKTVKADVSTSLVLTQWSKLGLEDLDFGQGKPLHMGPLFSDIQCLFLPVVGDFDALRVLVSLPERVVEKFEYYMKGFLDEEANGHVNGHHAEEDGLK